MNSFSANVQWLGVGAAGVGRAALGGGAAARGELAGEGRHAALNVSLRRGEVIVLTPGQCATQPSNLRHIGDE